ncbi:putative aldo/keto reductase [Eremomyces bilateralis CBS 781.70]|uniref:Aldo/keto reductase n=1 Tax=Eremomyces bilateralis CBS 781.70 TaxID=1392243 RepID=A0A6G1FSN5_9PEZI|nr:putative aldo/keto reductase [Eremomyces bilateralis CBS 781.70]KAF1808797.1 putative aldo/keto reductase [Eremomyces bilateralis CBS 781.70]
MPSKPAPLRTLGKNGPAVPAMGFGLMGLSGIHGPRPSDEERFQVLDHAVELGSTFWDTANVYGDSEDLLSRWFARTGKRGEIFLASKFALIIGEGRGIKGVDSSGEYCKRACEASLKRLGTDYIDLYYAHRVNPKTPIEETMRAMAELKAEGKIRNIGLCGVSSNTLRRACAIAPVAAVQFEYSPFVLDIEQASSTHLLQTCRELGIAVVCYSPLGRGMLSEAFTAKGPSEAKDSRASRFPQFREENRDGNAKIVRQFKAFADKKGCSTSQLALAWILKQGDEMFPIPGTKRIKYLEENWGALDVQLTDDDAADVRRFVEGAELAGDAGPAASKAFAFVDTKEDAERPNERL